MPNRALEVAAFILLPLPPGGPGMTAALVGDVPLADALTGAWNLGGGVAIGLAAPPLAAPFAIAAGAESAAVHGIATSAAKLWKGFHL